MADRKSLSIAEMLRRRKRAIEEGDPTGGEALDEEGRRVNAPSIREVLGIRTKDKKRKR